MHFTTTPHFWGEILENMPHLLILLEVFIYTYMYISVTSDTHVYIHYYTEP